MANENGMRRAETCPLCGKVYRERPALSREDNATRICPDCGTRQALSAMGVDADEQERILATIHRYAAMGKR